MSKDNEFDMVSFLGENQPVTENPPWKDEWKDMPEFVQEKQEPFALIKVRFDNQKDLDEFSELIGQKLTRKTKSIWHPELERGKNSLLRYIDDES